MRLPPVTPVVGKVCQLVCLTLLLLTQSALLQGLSAGIAINYGNDPVFPYSTGTVRIGSNLPTRAAISAEDCYFLLVDPEDESQRYVTRNGRFFFDGSYQIVDRNGYELQGLDYTKIYLKTTVARWFTGGSWVVLEEDTEREREVRLGSLSLAFWWGDRDEVSIQNPIQVRDNLIATDENGAFQYDGPHAIGSLIFGEEEGEQVLLGTTGWEILAMDFVYAAIDAAEEGGWILEEEDFEAIYQAASDEVYTRIFPNGDDYPHGLVPEENSSGFMEDLLGERGWLEAKKTEEGWLMPGVAPVLSIDREAVLARLDTMREEERFGLRGVSLGENGELWIDAGDLDDIERGRLAYVRIENPDTLIPVENGLYRVSAETVFAGSEEENPFGLTTFTGEGDVSLLRDQFLVANGVDRVEVSVARGVAQVPVDHQVGQGGLKGTSELWDLALSGDGFFLSGTYDGEVGRLWRGGSSTLSSSDVLLSEDGYPLLGYSGGWIGYRASMDGDGVWEFERDDEVWGLANEWGSVSMKFDRSSAKEVETLGFPGESGSEGGIEITNTLLERDTEGALLYNGEHAVGVVVFADESRREVLGTRGWQFFMGDALFEGRRLREAFDVIEEAALEQALSNDFYAALFPSDRGYEHGLLPGVSEEAERYGSFLREVVEKAGVELEDVIAEVELIESLYPASQDEAVEWIRVAMTRRLPRVVQSSVDSAGDVWLFLSDGESFVRARLAVGRVVDNRHLEYEGDGYYRLVGDGIEVSGPAPEMNRVGFGQIKQGALEIDRSGHGEGFDYRVEGEGWLRGQQSESGSVDYAARSVAFHLSEEGKLEMGEGLQVLGTSGDSLEFSVIVNQDGEWGVYPSAIYPSEGPTVFGTIELPVSTDQALERGLLRIQDELVARNEEGELVYNGRHRVGRIVYGDEALQTVESVYGWNGFLPTVERRIRAWVTGDEWNYWSGNKWIGEALSNDFYVSVFPNSEAFPHGHEPGLKGNGRRYGRFYEEAIAQYCEAHDRAMPSDAWFEAIEGLMPHTREEAIAMLNNEIKRNIPQFSRYAIRENGEVVAFMANGDAYVAGRIGLVRVEDERLLKPVGDDGLFEGLAAAGVLDAGEGNPWGLVDPKSGVEGELRYDYPDYVDREGVGVKLSWKALPGVRYRVDGYGATIGRDVESGEAFMLLDDASTEAALFRVVGEPEFQFGGN